MPSSSPEAYPFLTAIGTMAIAWKGNRVVGTFLPEADEENLLKAVRRRLRTPRLIWAKNAPELVENLANQIRAHLRGFTQTFTTKDLDLLHRAPFTLKVYQCLQGVPAGRVLSYRELAEAAGSPKAFRAVGQAMAKNPFPILIPCHRVVGTGNTAGGFSAFGGLETKAKILQIETRGPSS